MARKLKLKIPKRIAGVKIPKNVRKGPVGRFVNSSAGQLVLAEALLALGGTFALRRSDSSVGEFLRHPSDGIDALSRAAAGRARNARRRASDESERLADAFRAAMHAFHEAMERSGADVDEEGDGSQALSGNARESTIESPTQADSQRSKKNRGTSSTSGENPSTPH